MKAIVFHRYGPPDVLQLEEVEKPVCEDNEVLIRIHASTVTAGDCEIRRFDVAPLFWLPLRLYMGVRKPRVKILGQEMAGEVEAVGSRVTRYRPGDQLFGATEFNLGAYAEYICLSEDAALAMKPPALSYAEAAAVPVGGVNALYLVRKANLRSGDCVLINGAGGSIGTCALQMAKQHGAEVTAVDRADKLEMLRSLGADHVLDYTREDYTESGERYDAIIDIVGKSPYTASVRVLKAGGRFVLANLGLVSLIRGLWTTMSSDKVVVAALADNNAEDFAVLLDMLEAGQLRIVVDRFFPLERTAEAHRYVEAGRKKGNVIIAVGGSA